jgi:hypothetical protein
MLCLDGHRTCDRGFLRAEIWDAISSQAVGLGFVSSPLWGSAS